MNLLELDSSQYRYRLLRDTTGTKRVTIRSTCADRPTPIQALKYYIPHHFDQHTPLPPTAPACQIGSISISADVTTLT